MIWSVTSRKEVAFPLAGNVQSRIPGFPARRLKLRERAGVRKCEKSCQTNQARVKGHPSWEVNLTFKMLVFIMNKVCLPHRPLWCIAFLRGQSV